MHYRIVLCTDCFGFGLLLTVTERNLRSTPAIPQNIVTDCLNKQLAGSMRPQCHKCKGTGWIFEASEGDSVLRYLKSIKRPNINLDESTNEEFI